MILISLPTSGRFLAYLKTLWTLLRDKLCQINKDFRAYFCFIPVSAFIVSFYACLCPCWASACMNRQGTCYNSRIAGILEYELSPPNLSVKPLDYETRTL
jgi:hypothetical protein